MKILYSVLVVILLTLLLYFWVFHEGLSNDSGNWGDFGSYIGGVGNIIISIAIFLYSYQVNCKMEIEENRKNKELLLRQIERLLIKIQQHDNIIRNEFEKDIYARGNDSNNENETKELEIEIRASFAVCMSLAKAFGVTELPKEKDGVCIKIMREYANKWLNYIENKTL